MATINDLSEETLEKILLYVPSYEVKDLTLVSKKFNFVISNSIRLMSSFEVKWCKNKLADMRPLLESTRKYREISIEKMSVIRPSLETFLLNHSNTLTSINFFGCSLTSSDLAKVLTCLPNLVDFNLCDVNIEVDGEISPIQLKELMRMELMYVTGDGLAPVLDFFAGRKIIRFSYEDNFTLNDEEVAKFQDFLKNQRNLKDLSLSQNITGKIFDKNFVKSAEFQCVKLYLWTNGECDFRQQKQLMSFLESQKMSLRVLTLGRLSVSTELLNFLMMSAIQDLRLVGCCFPDSRPIQYKSETIRRVLLSMMPSVDADTERVLCNLLKRCKNITNLSFASMDVTFEMSLVVAYNLQKVEKLSLYRSNFQPMTFPILKHLEIKGCGTREVLQLIRVNRGLKTVTCDNHFLHSNKFQRALNETQIEEVYYSNY